jgi:iron only hydrogenase large subunit-like protein
MPVTIHVNNNKLQAEKGNMLLKVLLDNGIKIPTLCNISDMLPTGACRLCVVEIASTGELIPACSTPVIDGLRIFTHSKKVIRARQTIVDLLLTNHPEECLYCDKNRNCELQILAEELNLRERLFVGRKKHGKIDRSSQGIVLDLSKCILCGRCVKVCDNIAGVSAIDHVFRGKESAISTVFDKGLFYSTCIQCGNCLSVCPTGALTEKSSLNQVVERLMVNTQQINAILSTSSIMSIASYFGIRKFDDAAQFITAALREIGFNLVVPEGFGSDIFVLKNAEIVKELISEKDFKIIFTDCPSIKQWIEQKYPEYLKYIPKIKSAQQIMAKAVHEFNSSGKRLVNVAVAPCISRKNEALSVDNFTRGLPDIDYVISTTELLQLFRTRGITYPFPRTSLFDKPFISFSMSALTSQTTGGLSESIFNAAGYEEFSLSIKSKINSKDSKDLKIITAKLSNDNYGLAVLNGLKSVNEYFESIMKNKDIQFVELTACKGGCLAGCSQINYSESQMQKILSESLQQSTIKTPYNNPFLKGLLNENKISNDISGFKLKQLKTFLLNE